jgi:hypothetical protein
MKKETIEEAIHDNFEMLNCNSYSDFEAAFIAGIEWQQQNTKNQSNKILKFLDNEHKLGISDKKTIERIKWYFDKYFQKTLAILLFLPILSTAQHRPHFWAKQGFNTALAMYAGFTRHERDVIREKYKAYQAVWPKANPQWSNPQLSRYNKYKNGNVAEGRAKLLGVNKPVFLTDKYHLSTTIIRTSYAGIVGLNMGLYDKPKIKHILLQCLVTFAADAAGNGISTLIYKY